MAKATKKLGSNLKNEASFEGRAVANRNQFRVGEITQGTSRGSASKNMSKLNEVKGFQRKEC